MNKHTTKGKANQPAGGFVAIGREGPSTSSDSIRLKALGTKRDLPQVFLLRTAKRRFLYITLY